MNALELRAKAMRKALPAAALILVDKAVAAADAAAELGKRNILFMLEGEEVDYISRFCEYMRDQKFQIYHLPRLATDEKVQTLLIIRW